MDQSPVEGPPGGFWPRLGAVAFDSFAFILVLGIGGIVAAILIPVLVHSMSKDAAGVVAAGIFAFLLIGIPCLYFTLTTAFGGQTLGKRVFNLKVVRADGMPISIFRSFLRWLCSIVFSVPLFLGCLIAAFRNDRRALHDLVSGTKVVQIRPYNQAILIVFLCLIPFVSAFFGGMMAAIAIPRFAQMLEKSREAVTKANLSSLKSAVTNYYADHQEKYPSNLETDLVPAYLDAIPPVKATGAFVAGGQSPAGNNVTLAKPDQVPTGSGTGWLYDRSSGNIYVNSTVKDSKGVPYSFYGFQ